MAEIGQTVLARIIQWTPLLRRLSTRDACRTIRTSGPLLGILATALAAAMALPLIYITVIFPAYSQQIVSTIETGAQRLAAQTIPPSAKNEALSHKSLDSPHLLATIYRLEKNFEILKLNIYSPKGETLYSSDPKELKHIQDEPYFFDIVATGNNYSELTTLTKTGPGGTVESIDVVETFVPIMQNGKFLGAFEFYFDVSEVKQNMDRFNSYATYGSIVTSMFILIVVVILLNKESSRINAMEQAEKLREDVDQITRHDLKSPLVGALNGINYLERYTEINDEQRDMLSDMRASVVNGLDMINKSLDIYKMESGTYEYAPSSVDIIAVCRRVAADLAGLAAEYRVAIVVRREDDPDHEQEPLIISGESTLCYSLIANLVKNGIEASDRNASVGVTISVDANATIAIHNTGAVPESIREVFFDKFVTTGKRSGTGLGTYSARLMVKTMGGTITMNSSEADGTTVTVVFPLTTPTATKD